EHLRAGQANKFERRSEGHGYRTTYARRPDRIIIHLNFENVSDKETIKKLKATAEKTVVESGFQSDLPPIEVVVTGNDQIIGQPRASPRGSRRPGRPASCCWTW